MITMTLERSRFGHGLALARREREPELFLRPGKGLRRVDPGPGRRGARERPEVAPDALFGLVERGEID